MNKETTDNQGFEIQEDTVTSAGNKLDEKMDELNLALDTYDCLCLVDGTRDEFEQGREYMELIFKKVIQSAVTEALESMRLESLLLFERLKEEAIIAREIVFMHEMENQIKHPSKPKTQR